MPKPADPAMSKPARKQGRNTLTSMHKPARKQGRTTQLEDFARDYTRACTRSLICVASVSCFNNHNQKSLIRNCINYSVATNTHPKIFGVVVKLFIPKRTWVNGQRIDLIENFFLLGFRHPFYLFTSLSRNLYDIFHQERPNSSRRFSTEYDSPVRCISARICLARMPSRKSCIC